MILTRLGRVATYLLTYAIKFLGLASAVKELLILKSPDGRVLLFDALLLTGAQSLEGVILLILDKLEPLEHKKETENK